MFRKSKNPKVDKRKGIKREHNNIPDEIDIQLQKEKVDALSKTLDEDGKAKPITEKQLIALIRSAVRKKWMSCNTKLAFLEGSKVPDYDPTERRRFKMQCNMCKEWFVSTDINIDHKISEATFTDLSQALTFAQSILDVGKDDLQVLCVPCHEIKNVMDANGLSYGDAVVEKQAIAICKTKQDKEWLTDKGITPASSAPKRRQQIIEELLK